MVSGTPCDWPDPLDDPLLGPLTSQTVTSFWRQRVKKKKIQKKICRDIEMQSKPVHDVSRIYSWSASVVVCVVLYNYSVG